MPTQRTGPEIQQNTIRLKNLLSNAEEQIIAQGVRAPEAKKFLEPVQKLLHDSFFWQHQSDGLALFLSAENFHFFRLPLDFNELVVVTDRFHVKPLLPLFNGDGRFYILVLSQNAVRLLQGTRHIMREIDLQGMPKSLAEALKFDDPQKQLQFHTQTSGGERAAVFHGHGVGTDDTKDNILRYCQQIDRGLRKILKDEQSPLVFAGVDYLFSIYKEANTYSPMIDNNIEGNPEGLSEDELHKRAWSIVKPYFEKEQEKAIALYKSLIGTGRASYDLKEIISASYHGRVDILFFAVGVQQWGKFDSIKNLLEFHDQKQPEDEDLLDFAAVFTLIHGGKVYGMDSDKMPDKTQLAAVFRY
jgi:hypothetical protein